MKKDKTDDFGAQSLRREGSDSGSQLVTEQSWIKRENERDQRERADTIPDEETRRRKERSR